MRVVDLTQALDEHTVLWPGSEPFAAVADDGYDVDGYWSRHLSMPEHAGTHLDAPVHRVPGGAAVADTYVGDPPSFPGFGGDAAALLVERGAAGLGIDTLGVDAGAAADDVVHRIALPAGLWHLEGLVGLDAVPDTGATLVVGALRLTGGSGTPARVFALLP